ncbi:MAG: tandem-95 repeat protein [Dongiaceae bacterium]
MSTAGLKKILGTNKSEYLAPAGTLGGTDIDAGNGNDTAIGTGWGDIIWGGNGKDQISGGGGDDWLDGGNGVDTILGGAGNDTLEGGSGPDNLNGGDGNDRLIGGHGPDILSGGASADVFAFAAGDSDGAEMDCIGDFAASEDQIDLTALAAGGEFAWGGTTPTAHGAWYAQTGGNTYVYVDCDGNPATAELAIKLAGSHDLTPADFLGVVNPNSPPVTLDAGAGGNEDGAIAVYLGGADGDGTVTSVVLLGLPAHGTLYTDVAMLVPAAAGVAYPGDGATFYFMPNPDYNGAVSFHYTVIDDQGASDPTPATATIMVAAVNDAPGCVLAGDVIVAEDSGPQLIAGFATGISAGPTNESSQVLSAAVGTDNDGLFLVAPSIDPATGNLTFTPAPGANGTATVTVWLTDDGGTANGGEDSHGETFTITIVAANDGPTNLLPGPIAGDEDAVIPIAGLSVYDSDVNESPGQLKVTLSVANGTLTLGDMAGLAFIAGDGVADGAMIFTGTLSDVNAALATLSYQGNGNFSGVDTLTISTDDQGYTGAGGPLVDTDAIAITVNPVNDAPVAVGDGATVAEDGVLSASGLLANDHDPEADGLTAALVAGPAHGSLTLNPDGGYVYTPDANFFGADSFTYQAFDGTDLSNPATVTINVTPSDDAPVAVDDRWFISTGTSATFSLAALLGNDVEPDGDALTVTGLSLNGTTFVTDASDGTVDGIIHLSTGFGLLTVNTTADTMTYGVNGTVGSLNFHYQVSDGTTNDIGQVTVRTIATNSGDNAINLSGAPYNADADSFSYIDAKSGNDTLIGGAGADFLLGNGDIDLFRVGQLGEDTIRGGGNGLINDLGSNRKGDVLAFDGDIDLTQLDQTRITGIETMSMLDIHNTAGADSLILGAQDVIDLGQGTFDPFGVANHGAAAAIRVDGDSGDGLTLAGGDWRAISSSDTPSGYALYVHDSSGAGAAEDAYVLVQTSVTVTMG